MFGSCYGYQHGIKADKLYHNAQKMNLAVTPHHNRSLALCVLLCCRFKHGTKANKLYGNAQELNLKSFRVTIGALSFICLLPQVSACQPG